ARPTTRPMCLSWRSRLRSCGRCRSKSWPKPPAAISKRFFSRPEPRTQGLTMTSAIRQLLCLLLFTLAAGATSAGAYDDFFRAVRVDNAGAVRDLLARGFAPNTPDEQGQTGLLIAMRESSTKVVQL